MLYLFAIVCPPLAVLMCAKPITALLNLVLTLCCWLPGVVHAMAVVNEMKDDRRSRRYQSRANQVVYVNLPPTFPGAK